MQRGSETDLWNMRGRTGALQRLLLRATIVSAKGSTRNCSAIRAASVHCAASCAAFACAKIQTTDRQVRGIPSDVCCMLCPVCVGGRVMHVLLYGVSCMLCVCVFKNAAENTPLTKHKNSKVNTRKHRRHTTPKPQKQARSWSETYVLTTCELQARVS